MLLGPGDDWAPTRPGGETGRHAGLKILLPEMAVWVRFPPRLLKRIVMLPTPRVSE